MVVFCSHMLLFLWSTDVAGRWNIQEGGGKVWLFLTHQRGRSDEEGEGGEADGKMLPSRHFFFTEE